MYDLVIRAFVLFTAMPIHEFAHGWVANKLGDPTARYQGRLTLNPFAHLELTGVLMMLLVGFGWAKPVPINPSYFRNRKSGMALTALAGPAANILLAIVWTLVYKCIAYFLPYQTFFSVLATAFSLMASINISLAVFNLLPIPPLDGAKIFGYFLPDRIYWNVMQYERQIAFILFALLMFTPVLNVPLSFLSGLVNRLVQFLTGFVDLLARMV